MHPDLNHDKLQSKGDPRKSWWKGVTGAVIKFVINRVPFSDGDETSIYLAPFCKFITGEMNLKLNPREAIDEIIYIIKSLIKCYIVVDNNQHCLLSPYVKKVYVYMYVIKLKITFI